MGASRHDKRLYRWFSGVLLCRETASGERIGLLVTPDAAVVLGFLLIVLGIPMICRWVPRTAFDYLLMRGLALSDEAWYESHRRSGWDFVMLGAGIIVLATWMARASAAPSSVRDYLGASIVIALLITGVRSVIVTIRLGQGLGTRD